MGRHWRFARIAFVAMAAAAAGAAYAGEDALHASELIGERVAGRDGETLGEITELRLDTRWAGAHYIELARGEGSEASSFAYPVNALRRVDGALQLNVPGERLDQLPGFSLPEVRYVAARGLLGRAVDDALGNRAGTLVDVVIDAQSGQTRYFVVEFDEQGERLTLPSHNLRLQPGGNPVLRAARTRRG